MPYTSKKGNCILHAESRASEAVGQGVNPQDPACDLSTHNDTYLSTVSQLVGNAGNVNIIGGAYWMYLTVAIYRGT